MLHIDALYRTKQNSQAVQKSCSFKSLGEKVVKSKVHGSQEMIAMVLILILCNKINIIASTIFPQAFSCTAWLFFACFQGCAHSGRY